MARSVPFTSAGLVVGALAIAGMPPFGLFISEFMILTAAFSASRYFIAILMLIVLSVVFGALLHHFQQHAGRQTNQRPRPSSSYCPLISRSWAFAWRILIVFGIHIPGGHSQTCCKEHWWCCNDEQTQTTANRVEDAAAACWKAVTRAWSRSSAAWTRAARQRVHYIVEVKSRVSQPRASQYAARCRPHIDRARGGLV